MKYLRQIGMLVLMIMLGVAGYMAVQRYYAHQEDVKVQLFNFNSDSNSNHRLSYNRGYDKGYEDGLRDGQQNCKGN